jgi:hypothetical protein
LQKVNDAGLGRLGRRISVGMSLGSRKEKKLGRTDKEQKLLRAEPTKLNGKSSEPDEDGKSFSPASSKPTSRQPSPGPTKKQKGLATQPKPSAQDKRQAAYLRRLLEDTTPSSSNPLAILRMTHSNGSNPSSAWSRNISSTQSVEDCLRKFTAVEALDGDNMFGCRNVCSLRSKGTSLTSACSAGRSQMAKLQRNLLLSPKITAMIRQRQTKKAG